MKTLMIAFFALVLAGCATHGGIDRSSDSYHNEEFTFPNAMNSVTNRPYHNEKFTFLNTMGNKTNHG